MTRLKKLYIFGTKPVYFYWGMHALSKADICAVRGGSTN